MAQLSAKNMSEYRYLAISTCPLMLLLFNLKSVHITPHLHCGTGISIASLMQVTAASQHFK